MIQNAKSTVLGNGREGLRIRRLKVSTTPCPKCSYLLVRIPRRPIDRLTSQLVPVRRHHCTNFSCQWEGNLPLSRQDVVSRSGTRWSLAATTSLAIAGVVLLIAAATDLWVTPAQAQAKVGESSTAQPQIVSSKRIPMVGAKR